MKKYILGCLVCLIFFQSKAQSADSIAIHKLLDEWHMAAANADFKSYFDHLHVESIFIGTDAKERWNKVEFQTYAKPHFDRGKAWHFTSLKRFVNFSTDGKTAWVDELLDTQMKLCRGSGVLVLEEGKWYIKQYVLSMTIPNEVADQVIPVKAVLEDQLKEELINNKK